MFSTVVVYVKRAFVHLFLYSLAPISELHWGAHNSVQIHDFITTISITFTLKVVLLLHVSAHNTPEWTGALV